jgi:hypothetical protein
MSHSHRWIQFLSIHGPGDPLALSALVEFMDSVSD